MTQKREMIVYYIFIIILYVYIVLRRSRNRVHSVHKSAIQYAILNVLIDVTVLHDVLSGPEQRGNLA